MIELMGVCFWGMFTLLCLGMWDLGGHRVVVFLGARRAVLENEDSGGNTSFILAENRTRRIDPTGGFRHYRGGWNISNRHYFAVSFLPPRDPLFLSQK